MISFQLTRIFLPLKTPFITSLRRVENVTSVQLIITNSEGKKGIGEAPATKAITGETLESIELFIEKNLPSILKKESFEAMLKELHSLEGNSSAKACIEIALYNLFEKLHVPSKAIKTAITISLNPLELTLQDAKKAYNEGFNILKVKVDNRDVLEKIAAIQKALPEATLLIDANQAWSLEESLHFVKHLEGVALIEQPVQAKDIKSLKIITQNSAIPILADEAVFTLQDAKKIIEGNYANMINIKLMKCGGISKAIEILEYCRLKNVAVMFGSMLETPESIKAALQLSILYEDVVRYNDLDSPFLYKEFPQIFYRTTRSSYQTLSIS